MLRRATHAAQQHVVPVYLAFGALSLCSSQGALAAVVSYAARCCAVIALFSLAVQCKRSHVTPLKPPPARKHPHTVHPKDQPPTNGTVAAANAAPTHTTAATATNGNGITTNANGNGAGTTPYAVVTGASSGIGKAIASELAGRGWSLALVARNCEGMRQHADALCKVAELRHGVELRMVVIEADLTTAAGMEAVYGEVSTSFGASPPEIVVNCAGVAWDCEFADLPPEHLHSQLMVNVVATTQLTHHFANAMRTTGHGRILIVSSITAAVPNPKVAVYAATKSYLASFAQALSYELEPFGVGVTCVMPGATRTPFQRNANAQGARAFQHSQLVQAPEDVACAAVEGMLRGDGLVVTGWANRCVVHAVGPLLPRTLAMAFVRHFW